MARLKKRIEIYVPTIPGHEKEYQETMRLLSNICGGATETPATGSWIDTSGRLISDNIRIVYAYYNKLSYQSLRDIIKYIHGIKVTLNQELISVTYNNSLHLI